jgi:hypothetical protein
MQSILSELGDESLVVRGGTMDLVRLRISLQTSLEGEGYYSLSFFGDGKLSLHAVCAFAELPHGMVQVSRVARLRALGFEPLPEGYWPHLEIRFEMNPSDERLEELMGCFDDRFPIQLARARLGSQMTLIVDFNARRTDGLYAALLPHGDKVYEGSKVLAIDGDGLECQAEVVEIHPRHVLLRPIGGTWRDDSPHTISGSDVEGIFTRP